MSAWSRKTNREYTDTGGGFVYYVTIFNKDREQIEIFEETIISDKTGRRIRSGKVSVNIGRLSPGSDWHDWIQGDYSETKEFTSYKQALAHARAYMRRKQ